jgi:PAS domain S-box-containing protein
MHGYSSKKEIIGKNSLELIAPRDHKKAMEHLKKVWESGSLKNVEYTFLKKDGSEFPAEISANIIQDSSGKPVSIVGIIKDITERKQAEEALKKSENRYRTSIEITQMLAWTTSGKGEVEEDIPIWRKFTGQSYEEVKGSGWVKAIHPDDLERTLQIWTHAVETKSSYETEYRVRRYDRVYRSFLTRGVPILKEDGGIKEWIGICIDITDRKKTEEKIRESEAQLFNAVKIADLGPWEYDATSDIFTFNDSFYAIFRTTAEQVGGYTMSSADYAKRFVHPEDAYMVGVEVRKAIETDDPNFNRQLEHRIIYPNGEVGYVSVRFFIVKDEKGKTIRTYGVNQNITERKKADERIRESEEKYRALVENASDQIFMIDKEYKLISSNKAALMLWKKQENEVIGKHISEIFPKEIATQNMKNLENVFKTGKSLSAEEKLIVGEHEFWSSTSLNPVKNEKGETIAVQGIVRDITINKQVEQQLKNKIDELERFKKLAVGRELKMIELKIQIKKLEEKINSGHDL